MTPMAALREWAEVQLDRYQYQDELLVTGKMRSSESRGAFSAMQDTTAERTKLVKERIAELEKFLEES
jgi:hypothetical protein